MGKGKAAAILQSIADVAQTYVVSRQKKSLISTADAIWTIRYTAPHCEHTDAELAEIVASLAISQGRDVVFDHASEPANESRL
jgi:hypothetical protein